MRSASAHEVDIHIGKRVRMRRLMIDMSQESLAKHLGVTFQQVQKYESGANRISASRMSYIADVLRVPVSFFYDGLEDKVRSESKVEIDVIEHFLATKDGLALVTAFSQVEDGKLRRGIVDLVEAIVARSKKK